MTNNESLESRIQNWLEKQGYPLEMKVAAKLAELKFNVIHGGHYQDPETSTSREIDIVCPVSDKLGRGLVEINFIIECKGTNKPWILFGSKSEQNCRGVWDYAVLSQMARVSLIDVLHENIANWAKKIPWLWKGDCVVAHAITQAFEGNNDIPYAGVLSAVKAALWLQNHSFIQSPEYRKFVICFPVVITSSPLFNSRLDENNNLVLEPIDSGYLFFNQHINDFNGVSVLIVNENHLDKFVKECRETAEKLLNILEPAINQEFDTLMKSIK
jgi:hypothetical protein